MNTIKENQVFSKKCDRCNKYTRTEKSVIWYDRTNQDTIYYYCPRCFGAYWYGLKKMNRTPYKHIFVIKHGYNIDYINQENNIKNLEQIPENTKILTKCMDK